MTRPRSSAGGRTARAAHHDVAANRNPAAVVVALLLTFVLVGCGSSTATEPVASAPRATPEGASAAPVRTSPASAAPSAIPAPSPSGPVESSPSPATGGAGAEACSGTAENRDFFASMAAAVDWKVYCPVLADGWHVEDGQYRLANGGRLSILYRGPNRARVTLDEGAFCTIPGGCVAPGVDVGPTAFGDGEGTLVALDDGSWAVAVDREGTPSWILVVTGLDEAAARAIAADLVVVGG